MAYERILYEVVEGNIAKVIMNRPEKRNAQDYLMLEEIQDAFIQADLDDDVRVIIYGGAGKDFSAGHDLSGKGALAKGPVLGKALASKLTGMEKGLKDREYIDFRQCLAMRDVSKPTIAMVQGNCVAGAWQNAAMCDLIVAAEDARFSDPIVRMTSAGLQMLFHPYAVGFRKAKEMLWTAEAITAAEAKELGFVSRVVPRGRLEEETMALARKIAAMPPVAVSLVKRSVNHAQDEAGQLSSWQYHLLVHELSHWSDEKKRWTAETAKGTREGALKAMLDKK